MHKLKLTNKVKKYKDSDQWFKYYLQEYSKQPTKLLILEKIGVPYAYYKAYLDNTEGAKELEKLTEDKFQEILLQDIIQSVEEFPALKLKVVEKLVDKLNPKSDTTINIDQSQTLNCLGISQADAYKETQKLLNSFNSKQLPVKTNLIDVN